MVKTSLSANRLANQDLYTSLDGITSHQSETLFKAIESETNFAPTSSEPKQFSAERPSRTTPKYPIDSSYNSSYSCLALKSPFSAESQFSLLSEFVASPYPDELTNEDVLETSPFIASEVIVKENHVNEERQEERNSEDTLSQASTLMSLPSINLDYLDYISSSESTPFPTISEESNCSKQHIKRHNWYSQRPNIHSHTCCSPASINSFNSDTTFNDDFISRGHKDIPAMNIFFNICPKCRKCNDCGERIAPEARNDHDQTRLKQSVKYHFRLPLINPFELPGAILRELTAKEVKTLDDHYTKNVSRRARHKSKIPYIGNDYFMQNRLKGNKIILVKDVPIADFKAYKEIWGVDYKAVSRREYFMRKWKKVMKLVETCNSEARKSYERVRCIFKP